MRLFSTDREGVPESGLLPSVWSKVLQQASTLHQLVCTYFTLSLSSSPGGHSHLTNPLLIWTMNTSGFHQETPQTSTTHPAENTQDLTTQEESSTCKCTFMSQRLSDLALICLIDPFIVPCQHGALFHCG